MSAEEIELVRFIATGLVTVFIAWMLFGRKLKLDPHRLGLLAIDELRGLNPVHLAKIKHDLKYFNASTGEWKSHE